MWRELRDMWVEDKFHAIGFAVSTSLTAVATGLLVYVLGSLLISKLI